MKIKIYVASLADYNNGRHYGKWIDLQGKNYDTVMLEIKEMLKKSPEAPYAEEWDIHDYEAPFEISAGEDLRALMEILEAYYGCEASEEAKDAAAEIFNKDDLKNVYYDFCHYYRGECDSLEEYAEELYEESSDFHLYHYVNWEWVAEDLESDGYEFVDGHVFFRDFY